MTDLPLLETVVPYGFFDHSFFCRPDVRCESVDAGCNYEAQDPRKLVRIDTPVNIDLGVDRIDQTREIGRHRNKEGDNSTPILSIRGAAQCQFIGVKQIGDRTTPLVYR